MMGEALNDRPRVACIEWIDPVMAAGKNVVGEAGQGSLSAIIFERNHYCQL